MANIKRCPKCSRTYSDLTLSFCMEDGWLLSPPFDVKKNHDETEEITLVKASRDIKGTENLTQKLPTVTETIIRDRMSPSTSKSEALTGVIWKFGTNWGSRLNPSFYDFIKGKRIVIGRARFAYSPGDLVIVTEGFAVKAIARVKEEPKRLIENANYYDLFEEYNVPYDELVIYAKAAWHELEMEEIFQYKVQRGAARVNESKVKEKVFELWNKRIIKETLLKKGVDNNSENNIKLDLGYTHYLCWVCGSQITKLEYRDMKLYSDTDALYCGKHFKKFLPKTCPGCGKWTDSEPVCKICEAEGISE